MLTWPFVYACATRAPKFHRHFVFRFRLPDTRDYSVLTRLSFCANDEAGNTKTCASFTQSAVSSAFSSPSRVVLVSFFPQNSVPLLWTANLEVSAWSRPYCISGSEFFGMELKEVVGILKKMANPSLAGSWDNVGLLLEPSPPHVVNKLLLTNDLTPPVMQEAVDERVDMIVSYHPPIFAPLKRVTQSSWKERIVTMCQERRIAVYSPHTSWDAVAQGVNDWLLSAFDVKEVRPIEQAEGLMADRNRKLTFWTSTASAQMVSSLPLIQQNPSIHLYTEPTLKGHEGGGQVSAKVCMLCSASLVPSILAALEEHHIALDNVESCDLAKLPTVGYGMGRVGQLQSPIALDTAVLAIKSHLNLQYVRLAEAADQREVKSVAVCAGSGGSVLRGVKADLYLTGEMSHHEVLDAVCKGTHVVLCDHSNTERGFLRVIQARLMVQLAQKVQVSVSKTDKDPLMIL